MCDGMAALTPLAAMTIFLCSFTLMFDGICIGTRDYKFLPRVNMVSTAGTLGALQLAKSTGSGLHGVWLALVTFFTLRLGQHVLHLVVNYNTHALGRYNVAPVIKVAEA